MVICVRFAALFRSINLLKIDSLGLHCVSFALIPPKTQAVVCVKEGALAGSGEALN